jgi:hypothetical protein
MRSKTTILLHIPSDSTEKLPTEDFLRAHIDYGLWIRPIAIQNCLQALSSGNLSDVELISLEANLHTLFGMWIEDILTSLIAIHCWSHREEKALADIFANITISELKDVESHTQTRTKLLSQNKRSRVDPGNFLSSILRSFTTNNLPNAFGIKWSADSMAPNLTVKQREFWSMLPHCLDELLRACLELVSSIIPTSYNKIKHGPQIHITCFDSEFYQTGESEIQLSRKNPILQILLKGADVHLSYREMESGRRVAPFVVPGIQNKKDLFYYMILPRFFTWISALEILESQRYGKRKWESKPYHDVRVRFAELALEHEKKNDPENYRTIINGI